MDRSQLLNDAEQAMRLVLDGRQSGIWTALPGIVDSYDASAMTLVVQPAIQGVVELEDGTSQTVNLPLLVDVPVCFPSGGGFLLTFPIVKGDEVLVIIASRCIDSWWQNGGIGKPIEARMHDLSDGFAIPGPRSQPKKVSAISSNSVQLRNDAGSTFIEIDASGKIKLKASEIDVVGNLKVTGLISASGEVTGNSATIPINLTTHTHTSASPGNPTGPPLP